MTSVILSISLAIMLYYVIISTFSIIKLYKNKILLKQAYEKYLNNN